MASARLWLRAAVHDGPASSRMREPSSVVNESSSSSRATCTRSAVAEGVDQLALVHLRAALDADVLRLLLEVALRPVLVAARLAALAAGRAAVGVRDPRGLLLARALLPQPLVLAVVLYARTLGLGPRKPPSLPAPSRYP